MLFYILSLDIIHLLLLPPASLYFGHMPFHMPFHLSCVNYVQKAEAEGHKRTDTLTNSKTAK